MTWRSCSFWSAYWGPLYAPTVHTWTGCWGGSTQPCFWAWVVAFLPPHNHGELFNTASASSSLLQGARSCTSSLALKLLGPAHLHPHLQDQHYSCCSWGGARPALRLSCPWGQLSHMLQVTMVRRERASLPHPCHHMAHEGELRSACLLSCPQSLLTCRSVQVKCRVHIPKCHSQWGALPALPPGSQNQLSHLPQVSSGGCGCGHLSLPHFTIWQMKERTRSPMLFHEAKSPAPLSTELSRLNFFMDSKLYIARENAFQFAYIN